MVNGISYVLFLFESLFGLFSGCSRTGSVDQASFELKDPPDSTSQVLGLKDLNHHNQWKENVKDFQRFCVLRHGGHTFKVVVGVKYSNEILVWQVKKESCVK